MTPEQFKHRVLPLKNKLFRFSMAFLKHEEEARDVVQDVMLKCWEALQTSKKIDNLEAWCMTLTRNKSLDLIKKKGRNHDELTQHYELSSSLASPLEQTESREIMQNLHALIQALPNQQKTAILLRDVEGNSYKEVADIMKIDINHVKVLIHRGRTSLRNQLKSVINYGIN
ncbi:MAG: RNA polymerase sigma factor [Bacteroidia bacterium]